MPVWPAHAPAADQATQVEFENEIVGGAIPPNYVPACEKGFREAANSGALIGFPVEVGAPSRRLAALLGTAMVLPQRTVPAGI